MKTEQIPVFLCLLCLLQCPCEADPVCRFPDDMPTSNSKAGCAMTLTLYTSQVTWAEARAHCESRQAKLVDVDFYSHLCMQDGAAGLSAYPTRIWTGVYFAAPFTSAFTRGNCFNETLDWEGWNSYPSTPTSSQCVTADPDSLNWHARPCDEKHAFVCQSWEYVSTEKQCQYKTLSLGCVFDKADYSLSAVNPTFCKLMCDLTPRCWGTIPGALDSRSFSYNPGDSGCTNLMADAPSSCRHTPGGATYPIDVRMCYTYEVSNESVGQMGGGGIPPLG